MSMRRLGTPRPAAVSTDDAGRPAALGGSAVASVNEDWVVEDRWWSAAPIRRRYFEVVLEDGRNTVVFCDLPSGRWFLQRS